MSEKVSLSGDINSILGDARMGNIQACVDPMDMMSAKWSPYYGMANQRIEFVGPIDGGPVDAKNRSPALGRKDDSEKVPVFRGLIAYFAAALKAVAVISRFGKEKYKVEYEDKNWEKVEHGSLRYTDADARHLFDEVTDGLYDPESGYLHAAHHAWDSLARLQLMLKSGIPLQAPERS